MKILVINGPNLNMLGKRNKLLYGNKTLIDIEKLLHDEALKHTVKLQFFQSNHEGVLIDFIQKNSGDANGILINPGALTHYGYSLRDALIDTQLPVVSVHMTDITKRELFRAIDVFSDIVIDRIVGFKENSYIKGFQKLVKHITT